MNISYEVAFGDNRVTVDRIARDGDENPDVRVVGGRLAFLSAALTAREQGPHGGSSRQQIIDLLVRSRIETRPELLDEYIWPSSDPFGRVSVESMLDMQARFARNNSSVRRCRPTGWSVGATPNTPHRSSVPSCSRTRRASSRAVVEVAG